MTKYELRKIYLAKQKFLSISESIDKSRQIYENFFKSISIGKLKFFHVFLPIEKNNEIDTSLIINLLRREMKKIVVPRVNFEKNEIDGVEFKADSQILLNKWQISEPSSDETVEPQNIDLVIVPLLCFDKRGFRVGYGKGFYDKFLKNCRADCLKIGLSFFSPIEKISDTNKYDVMLDYCITPKKVFKFNQ